MNATKTLICILTAGAALGAATPVFAGPERDRGDDRDRGRNSYYDRQDHRAYSRGNYNRDYNRDYDRRQFVVVRRPYIARQPVYYHEPAPVAVLGMGAVIGAVIGSYIDNRRDY